MPPAHVSGEVPREFVARRGRIGLSKVLRKCQT